jgi:hypothetical protein
MDEDCQVRYDRIDELMVEQFLTCCQFRTSRLLALSHPSRTITKEIWVSVLAMDQERITRLEAR